MSTPATYLHVAPPSACNREDGGTWLKSAIPSITRLAPSQAGSNSLTDMAAAIAAISSTDRMDIWRVLRISVPLRCCAATREQDARVSPECASPVMPAKVSSTAGTGTAASPAARSGTRPSQRTVAT